MRHILAAAALAAVSALAAPAAADMVADCVQEEDRELRIAGCTELIRSGEWQGKDLSWAYHNRGITHAELGQHFRAAQDYDVALTLDPELAEAYYNRAISRAELGEPELAVADYDAALRLAPENIAARYNRGVALAGLGRDREAVADFDAVLEADPSRVGALINRGFSRKALGEAEAAVEDWEQAILQGGPEVAKLFQEHLKTAGHYRGAVDGIYGPNTRRSLVACAEDPAC